MWNSICFRAQKEKKSPHIEVERISHEDRNPATVIKSLLNLGGRHTLGLADAQIRLVKTRINTYLMQGTNFLLKTGHYNLK